MSLVAAQPPYDISRHDCNSCFLKKDDYCFILNILIILSI